MSHEDEGNTAEVEAWAQLVCVTDMETSVIPVVKNTFVIGRNHDCDLPHPGNKLVSGRHCYIERDDNGKVWLYDTSTNGTLLNLSIKLSKGECRELKHGDEIHVVHKKGNTEDDIGYMFQDPEALRAESSSDTEETQEYTQVDNDPDSTIPDEDANTISIPSPLSNKRKSEESPEVSKKRKVESPSSGVSSSTSGKKEEKMGDKPSDKDVKPHDAEKLTNDGQPASSGDEQPTSSTSVAGQKGAASVKEPEEDAIAETLICIICQELLHDCISLQPCMHSFCGGCYSEWMERSKECPSCRTKVDRINKNHIVNNLVEAYLKLKPEKKRPEADLKELDGKNKITRDMLVTDREIVRDDSEDYTDSDEAYERDNNSDDNNSNDNDNEINFNQGGFLFGIGTPLFGTTSVRPGRTVCRQCPGYNAAGTGMQTGGLFGGIQGALSSLKNIVTGTPTTTPAGTIVTPGPSTATDGATQNPDVKTFPTAPAFTCPINGAHVLCLCCMQPMPDRRNQYVAGGRGTVPPQQCALCFRAFCHAYWGCHKVDCNGCLAKFKDLNFGKKCLTSLILDNAYESEIFKNYLEEKGLSVKDVFADCLAKMVTGEYPCTNAARIAALEGINTPMCYACGLFSFKELVYLYRKEIPNSELPNAVTSRSDCYWGKQCRTQKNKPEHARRFNHICDQTRTT